MSRRNRRPAAVALAAGITVLLLASATAGGAQTGAPQHGTGVTATSITVAGLGDSSLYGGADLGARARFQRANDDGGVHGRTVDYAGFTDDGGDPTAGTSAATALVQQRQVFAVVPAVTPDFAAGRFLAGRTSIAIPAVCPRPVRARRGRRVRSLDSARCPIWSRCAPATRRGR